VVVVILVLIFKPDWAGTLTMGFSVAGGGLGGDWVEIDIYQVMKTA
jgi:hypothetical protein